MIIDDTVVLQPDAQLNSKRLFINVSSLIESNDHLLSTWNDLARSNEILFDVAGSLPNENQAQKASGCKCEQVCNQCDFCLQSQNDFQQKFNFRSNDFFKTWIWTKQPSASELRLCISKMIEEQQQYILKIANNAISMNELKMLLIVTKRFFIAFQKSQMKYFRNRNGNVRNSNAVAAAAAQIHDLDKTDEIQSSSSGTEADEYNSQPHLSVLNTLKKIGLKTTLSFVFIFLQKSWKCEEDAVMCNLLLSQLLESIQNLPIGSLFELETLPAIWLESITRIEHFLHQIIFGKLELVKDYEIPLSDKKLTLATLLEVTLQKGRLSKILEFVLLLNDLSGTNFCKESKTSHGLTNGPFVCSLNRLQSFDAAEQQKSLKSPIGSFLRHTSLPRNPEALIALDATAVFIMCHLSRLSDDLLKKCQKSRNISQRNLYVFGSINYYGQFYTQTNDSFDSKLIVKQIVCALSLFLILSDCGLVYSMNYDCDSFLAKPISGFGSRKIVSIASNFGAEHFMALSENGEVFSWGCGKDGRLGHGDTKDMNEPKIIGELSDKNIVFIACGSNFSAAVSNIGILFTWGHSGYGRLGHGTIEDCLYPTAVTALVDYHVSYVSCGSKDAHTLCCTKDGKLFSWGDGDYGKLGRGGSAPSKLPKPVDELDKVFITQVCCGDQFSIALADNGHVYSWGKGEDYRLGHETEDHVRYPKLIEALRLVKIVRVSTAATHVLAVSEQGDVYGWGKNDHFQVSNSQEFLIRKPTLISYHRDINAKNIATGVVQSFIWSDYVSFKFADRAKFVLELSNDTFVFLEKLLKLGYDKLTEKNAKFSQYLELLVISTFDLLNLHLLNILLKNENNDENCDKYDPFDLSGKFCSLIVSLATGEQVLKTVQTAAQEVLKNSWKLLFRSIDERIKTLSYILRSSNDTFDKLTNGEKFLVELFLGTLKPNEDIEMFLSANNSKNIEMLSVLNRQLLQCLYTKIEYKLLNLNVCSSSTTTSNESKSILSLILTIQRILGTKVSKNESEYSSIYSRYVKHLCEACQNILRIANNLLPSNNLNNIVSVFKCLKCGLIDTLLSEATLCLIMLHMENKSFANSLPSLENDFLDILRELDTICKQFPFAYELDDSDFKSNKNHNVSSLSHNSKKKFTANDYKNEKRQNRNILLIGSDVYDVTNYRSNYECWTRFIEENRQTNATNNFHKVPFNSLLIKSLELFRIGYYWHYEISEQHLIQQVLPIAKTFLTIARHVAYFLGFRIFCLHENISVDSCTKFEHLVFLSAGLKQGHFPHNIPEDKTVISPCTPGNQSTNEFKQLNHRNPRQRCYFSNTDISSFVFGLAEGNVYNFNTTTYLQIIVSHCKNNNFLIYPDFEFDHPVEKMSRTLHAAIIYQLGLGYMILSTISTYSANKNVELPKIVVDLIESVHKTQLSLIKVHQQFNKSYKELCLPIIEKCRFLLHDINAVISSQQNSYETINFLHSVPKFKKMIREKIVADRKLRKCEILSCHASARNSEDANKWTKIKDTDNEFKKMVSSIVGKTNEKFGLEAKKTQSKLLKELLEFVVDQKSDVQVLRQTIVNHIKCYERRKKSFDLLANLLENTCLLPSIYFAIFHGYFAVASIENRNPKNFNLLSDCGFIGSTQKVDLLLAKNNVTNVCTRLITEIISTSETMQLNHEMNLKRNDYLSLVYALIACNVFDSKQLSSLINCGILSSTLHLINNLSNELLPSPSPSPLSLSSSLRTNTELISNFSRKKEHSKLLTGPETAKFLKKGTRVVRGPDWKWGNQDESHTGKGYILSDICADGWVRVEWDNGSVNSYRMGKDNKYDLRLASIDQLNETVKNFDSVNVRIRENEQKDFKGSLRDICVNFLQMISLSVGLNSDRMEPIPLRNFCNLIKDILFRSNETNKNSWCSLSLALAICQDDRMKKIMSQEIWIGSLLHLIESKSKWDDFEKGKPLLAIKLLNVIIATWFGDFIDVKQLLEKLLTIFGHLTLSAYSNDKLSTRFDSKTAQNQSYGLAVCQELILMIRNLCKKHAWSQVFVSFFVEKLKNLNNYLETDVRLMEKSNESLDLKDNSFLVHGILNVLAVNCLRPRIGSRIVTNNQENGVIVEFCGKDKCMVQLENFGFISEYCVRDVTLKIESEICLKSIATPKNSIEIWRQLFTRPKNISDCKKTYFSDNMNTGLLKVQQFQISSLSAAQSMFDNQAKLRKILKNESCLETFEQVLKKAVEPVPLRAQYALKELTLAALDLSRSLVSDQNQVRRKQQFHIGRNSPTPISDSIVNQLIEMGFSETSIHYTIKMFAANGNASLEKLIAWLIENCEDRKDMMKSLNFDAIISSGSVEKFKTRADFSSNSDYAKYINDNARVGMIVKSNKNIEKIEIGDFGLIEEIDNDAAHSLTLKIYWKRLKMSNWTRSVNIEIIGVANIRSENEIKIGDRVKVKKTVTEPKYKWGMIDSKSVGVVKAINQNGTDFWIDFEKQSNWQANVAELEVTRVQSLQCAACSCSLYDKIYFKCKVCSYYILCEPCFQEKKLHWHPFDKCHDTNLLTSENSECSENVPNIPKDSHDEWNKCIKNISVSSNPSVVKGNRLKGVWKSSNSAHKNMNWIRLEINGGVIIDSLKLEVDPSSLNFMPSLIDIKIGSSFDNLKKLATIKVAKTDKIVNLLPKMNEHFPAIEIVISKCWNSRNEFKIVSLSIKSSKKSSAQTIYRNLFAADFESSNDTNIYEPLKIENKSSKVYVWGLNDRDQLASEINGTQIRIPAKSEILEQLYPVSVSGGAKSLFIVSHDGKAFACGEGLNGRLGLGHCCNVSKPTLISALSQYVIKKIAVHSCGRHSMALTNDGKVFSWGEGDDGRLGHGNRLNLELPKPVKFFANIKIRDISCGTSHSAAITSSGNLYTWGLGDYGRLGHGDDMTQLQPKLVESLIGKCVQQVACGGRDAQTLALLDNGLVYSWGDADFGKLGRSSSETNFVPEIIDTLSSVPIKTIGCGAQFSVALAENGDIYSWGRGDYFRLGHGSDQHVRKPMLIESLRNKHISRVAVGALHCLVLTADSQVFVWGDNDHGQQGDGTTSANRQPALVMGLEDVKITNISCGSSHCIAWNSLVQPIDCCELVLFESMRDNLGSSLVKRDDSDCDSDRRRVQYSKKFAGNDTALSNILMSIESNVKKQEALNHLIQSIHIQQSRRCIVRALASHKQIKNVSSTVTKTDTEIENIVKSNSQSEENLQQLLSTSTCSTSLSSRHSKLSPSSIALDLTNLTSEDLLKNTNKDTDLDDFTSLIASEHIYDLLKLLKLAIFDRVEDDAAKETIASTLKSLALSNGSVRELLVKFCVTELEDVFNEFNYWKRKPKPVVQESRHPYAIGVLNKGQVVIPEAESLRIEFDPKCCTEKQRDFLQIEDQNGQVIGSFSGKGWFEWPETRLNGCELNWTFSAEGSISNWGWKFTVYPIMKVDNVSKKSDRSILSFATIEIVRSLFDEKMFSCLNGGWSQRFVTALTKCFTIVSLTLPQRIWSLKTLYGCLLSSIRKHKDFLKQEEQKSKFATLIKELPQIILSQYEYEEYSVKSGRHLMHSEFLKTMLVVASDLGLDTLPLVRDSNKWRWFTRYTAALKVMKSIINRTELPTEFLEHIVDRILQINLENVVKSADFINHDLFRKEHDEQLLQWFIRKPNDWTLSNIITGCCTIYGWGHNHRGQLGGVEGAKVKIPTTCESLSSLKIAQIIGGEQTLFAVTVDGKVYCSGHGANGRLGIGCSESVQVPTLIESLVHVVVKKLAVNAGGHHCLVLTNDFQVYSWGEGDDGKLGHGNRINCDKPKLIEAFKNLKIVNIACGGHHSAAVTSDGVLYTWGKGRYGRLGHGDSEDQLQPKIVEVLNGFKVVDIACGCGDSQTLCITDDDNVWSWGDGDYGKLGRGGSEGCKIPIKIDSLAGLGVIKVECGSQFSIALTRSGSVYTWGKGDYYRLGHGNNEHVRRPKKVSALHGKRVISVAIGSLHCVACTDTGEIFSWGDNDEGQLGDGSTNAISRPKQIRALQNVMITNIACGSAHTLAWSVTQKEIQRVLPTNVPLEYDLLKNFSPTTSYCRLVLLHSFSELVCPQFALLPLSGPISLNELRTVLAYSVKESMFRKIIQTTMIRDIQHGPLIELNRLNIYKTKTKCNDKYSNSVFGQMACKSHLLKSDYLLLPHRVWKVKFVGESVDDCGGGFNESIAEMCDELQNSTLPLLILSPNGRDETGTNRDCFVLNSSLSSVQYSNMFRFLGTLMGIAIRTGSPLNLNIAEPIWKLICGTELNAQDLIEIDRDFIPTLLCIKEMNNDPKEFELLEMPFTTTSTNGSIILLSSKYKYITLDNRNEYIKLALDFRLHEFDSQIEAIKDGMSKVIPVPLLTVFRAYELEALVCGTPEISLAMLKTVATYKGIESNSPLVQWFWEVMEEFSNEERSLFLRFVWGRTRLPRTISDFRGRDFVIQIIDKYNPADFFLPESYTCFFLLKMPRYSCKMVLKEKLKYAIHFCKAIDTDEYARVAIVSENDQTNELELNSFNSDDNDFDV